METWVVATSLIFIYLVITIALGVVAHNSVLAALGHKQNHCKFAHNARYTLPGGLVLADSYHCSRYNTNTGRLTEAMFHEVFAAVKAGLD